MRPWGAVLIATVMITSCTPGQPASSLATPTPTAVVVSAGCGTTPIFKGGAPEWAHALEGTLTYQEGVPYVLASPPTVIGFLFGFPLRAGHPQNPSNKILWLVDLPPRAGALDITAHPFGTVSPSINSSAAFLASGDIPSTVDAPKTGCWAFDLAWSGHHATLDLNYQ